MLSLQEQYTLWIVCFALLTNHLTRSSDAPCIRIGTSRTVQNSAANRIFLVSVPRYAFSKSAIFATNFEQFGEALDFEQALKEEDFKLAVKIIYEFIQI